MTYSEPSDRKVEIAVVLDNTENHDLEYLEIYSDVINKAHKNKEIKKLTLLSSLPVTLK